jgi:hypothetical protein
VKLYRNKDVVDGLSAKHCIGYDDEWLCEAYMQTDYSKLTQDGFQQTVNDFFAYMVKVGAADLECKYKRSGLHSNLDIKRWKEFKLKFIFDFSKGRRLTKADMIPGDLNYLDIAMFLITVIKANKYRFGYGRKWTLEKMKETVIKLPSRADGAPDFIYMESYIKSLSYSDRI